MNGTVIGGRHFARKLIDGKFHDIVAATRNLEAERRRLAGRGLQRGDFFAIHLHGHLSRTAAGGAAVIEDAQCQLLLFVDDAEARSADYFDTAVELIGLAGDQPMDRRAEAQRLFGIGQSVGNIVNLAVAEEDRAADAGW
ncbi:hypothetical protein D3C71_801000 [compost metagenome]